MSHRPTAAARATPLRSSRPSTTSPFSPLFAQVRATRLFANSPSASGDSNQLGGSARSSNQAQNQQTIAGRRQLAFETQLKEGAFLKATIKLIVDGTATFKPPVPYAIRAVKRGMDKGIHFQNNTYGAGGFPEIRTQRRCTNMATGLGARRSVAEPFSMFY